MARGSTSLESVLAALYDILCEAGESSGERARARAFAEDLFAWLAQVSDCDPRRRADDRQNLQDLWALIDRHDLRDDVAQRLEQAEGDPSAWTDPSDRDRPVMRDGSRVAVSDAVVYRGPIDSIGGSVLSRCQDLAQIVYRTLGRTLATPIALHPAVKWPREVAADSQFTMCVTVRPEAGDDTVGAAVLHPEQPGPVFLEVELHVPTGGEITAVSQRTQAVQVDGAHDSAEVKFDLIAREPGLHDVAISIRRHRLELIRVSAPVLVRPRNAEIAREARAAAAVVSMPSAPYEYVVLRVEELGEQGDHRVQRLSLRGPRALAGSEAPSVHRVRANSRQLLVELCETLRLTVREVDGPDERVLRLCSLGASLGRALLTEPVRTALRRLPEGTALHIESEDAWAPWEMVRLEDASGGFFLAERFAVTRSVLTSAMDARLPGGAAVLVAPRDSGLSTGVEQAALAGLTGASVDVLGSYSQVWNRMREPSQVGFLHFGCHGKTDRGNPHGGPLLLAGGATLRPVDVPRFDGLHEAFALRGACVFINACKAGVETATLYDHDTWTRAFLEAGAYAVIAPSWEVSDKGAAVFAETFYRALGEHTVGEAARLARVKARRQGCPDWLAYAVFAAPYARLAVS